MPPELNGHKKWMLGIIVGLISFISVTFIFNRLSALEERAREAELRVERMDAKLDEIKAAIDRLQKRL